MNEPVINRADISEQNCEILHKLFEEHYSQENTPSSYLATLPHELHLDFYEKIEMQ